MSESRTHAKQDAATEPKRTYHEPNLTVYWDIVQVTRNAGMSSPKLDGAGKLPKTA